LPLTAILKLIFEAIPGLKSYAFLLGSPEKYHLKKHSLQHIQIVQRMMDMRKQKPIIESLPDESSEEGPTAEPDPETPQT
jgi:hypothetical protein